MPTIASFLFLTIGPEIFLINFLKDVFHIVTVVCITFLLLMEFLQVMRKRPMDMMLSYCSCWVFTSYSSLSVYSHISFSSCISYSLLECLGIRMLALSCVSFLLYQQMLCFPVSNPLYSTTSFLHISCIFYNPILPIL